MRFLFVLILFASLACGPAPKQGPAKVKNAGDLKKRLTQLASERRRDSTWMDDDECPADIVPLNPGKEERGTENCSELPEGCLSECESGNGNSCWALARLVEKNSEKDQDVSNILFRK